ncbi:hypothetical protein [Croceicoccus naphthovorans]|uniref:Uncharacterized protein n=1 Tax=Croceicoccus naphthovorans TaxID=1348774 RepID=A0A0G3XGW1_9SPHN|nr:hypothetical protein [Croceicoccus naphthovorans]AKM09859.1 hypothetical protein AB433_07470 [Croceicoccus naphthovorans]MBB3991311.1 hypothetical protein [Croceicoccus naphthovorans]
MIAAADFIAAQGLTCRALPPMGARPSQTVSAFPVGSRDWNVMAVAVWNPARIVIEVVREGLLEAVPMSFHRACELTDEVARGLRAAGAEAARVTVHGVTFASEEAEALDDVLRRAIALFDDENRP